ncbi:sensor histidine kinase [Natronincola ferrireducens]|uniref:histidine kinase n=1 Tax=Natronincola ferrireducens TaxID=393762 RepID=A0A1G9GJN1_9FIRM|nr:HAMP domain-containing sensor histidine kinase [Natronincola ferrireducens]SDL00877.1 Signal transduction histidine kinase [Natronincola ferrireducens]
MKSIKKRLVFYFVFIIIITVVILEVVLLINIQQHYYSNLEGTLINQLQTSTDLYEKYFSDATLQENILNNVDTFWNQTSAQVAIIDMKGRVLMDSIGVMINTTEGMEDVERALEGELGKWVGNVDYDTERVMAVSYPLYSKGQQVGVLRFVASLREINNDIKRITHIFIAFGILVTLISGLVSIFLANTITVPLEEVTLTAEKMAKGDYYIENQKRSDDEIGKLSDTLNYMAKEIIKKDQIKNDFISSVSHELRTPLTSIKGWAVTLKQDYEDKEILSDGLEIIEKESDRLTLMVEELLDFSKFVSGKITFNIKPTDLKEILKHVKKQLTPRALREEVDFQLNYADDFPLIYCDENRLKQVLINLLDNAFKFTPSNGKISLLAKLQDDKIVIVVEDTGSGIDPEELPKVKEKFYKGKSSKSQNGIGLTISDAIVKMMGGSLDITSQLDKGTRVTLTLPLQEVV